MLRLLIFLLLAAGTALAQVSRSSGPPGAGSTTGALSGDEDLASGNDLPCPEGRNKTAEARFGEYVLRTYRWPEPEGCLLILKRGAVVYSLTSTDFRIGDNFEGGWSIPVGTDITGAGKPNAVVSEWSGGAHCCFTVQVFELADNFREIAKIEADHSDTAHFVDLDHDGYYEFEGYGWAFAYWGTSFALSPAPRIVLKYSDARFRLALDLMRKPNPTPEEFATLVRTVQADREWDPKAPLDCDESCGVPVVLWRSMLELMYSGHADFAWRLVDQSWPAEQKGKTGFIAQFCKQLSSSHYWPELKELIGPCPPQIKP